MNSAIIVAAGKGTRMGPTRDKLFLPVAGRPLIAHTWRQFVQAGCIEEIILVIREDQAPDFHRIAREEGWRKPYRLVNGGAHRQDSVWNGLQALSPQCRIVAIHDGARPCVGTALIQATIAAADACGAAVAAQRVTDTIKEADGGDYIAQHLDRTRLWAVQTPQTFRVEVIQRALAEVRAQHLRITDDTAACEVIGQTVRLVESRAPNPKATVPADIAWLEVLLRQES